MISNYLKFLKDYEIDTISAFIFQEAVQFKNFLPHGHCGVDHGGHPMYWEKLGSANLKKALQLVPEERYVRQYLFEYMKSMEMRLVGATLKQGQLVETFVSIIDVGGEGNLLQLQLSATVRALTKKLIALTGDCFPETLHKMYIINAPKLFSKIWNMVKKLLDEKTQKKIHILDKDYLNVMLEDMDIDQIPDVFGGKTPWLDLGPWADPAILAVMKRWRYDEIMMKAARKELWPIGDSRWETESDRQEDSHNRFVTKDGWPLLVTGDRVPIPGNGPHASADTKAAAASYVQKMQSVRPKEPEYFIPDVRQMLTEVQELQAAIVKDVSQSEPEVLCCFPWSSWSWSKRTEDEAPVAGPFDLTGLAQDTSSAANFNLVLSKMSVWGLWVTASMIMVIGLKKFRNFQNPASVLHQPLILT